MRKGSSKKHQQPPKVGGEPLDIQSADSAGGQPRANQIVICKHPGCHDIVTTQTFCRFHYLASWKKMKTKEAKKRGQELEVYLDELSKKFPEEFLEKLRNEVEDMSEKEQIADSEEGEKGSLFDQMDSDEDLETIIQGLKVEDF